MSDACYQAIPHCQHQQQGSCWYCKVDKVLNELEKIILTDLNTLIERINKLENKDIDHQIKRIAALEKNKEIVWSEWNLMDERIDDIVGKLNEVYTKTMGIIPGRKQPHKCPVCEGKGIVWG